MRRLQRAAVLLALIDRLWERGSWCGETHIQKSVYFLQALLGVPLGFDFQLYKYGPYSFDLSAEIANMRADELLRLVPQPPYGPSFVPDEGSKLVQKLYPKTLRRYFKHIEFVADIIGNKNVSDLESLATALYVSVSMEHKEEIAKRAQHLKRLKPHLNDEKALSAVRNVDKISNRADHARLIPRK